MGTHVCIKNAGDIEGSFVVGSYQRGYRWDEQQVYQLLDDLRQSVDAGTDYHLHPIVVRKRPNGDYSLIDGQQRLTTLFILLNFIKRKYRPDVEMRFSLKYDTRPLSEEFLRNPDEKTADDDIDFFFMNKANETIDDWFDTYSLKRNDALYAAKLYTHLCTRVKVIWYENDFDDEIALFTRINIGSIPLTNADLIKAMFLCRDDEWTDERRQNEIAMQWDDIERQLCDKDFWYLLTNDDQDKHPTKIDLFIDIASGYAGDAYDDGEKYAYGTYLAFKDMVKEEGKEKLWNDILGSFFLLKKWYASPTTYNKIGFMAACGFSFDLSYALKHKTAKRLIRWKGSLIHSPKPYSKLRYGPDSDIISDILLLFNIRSLKYGQRYNFAKHKVEHWTPGYIDAQCGDEELDKLSNLALLPRWQDPALNNSAFSVKRDKILEMDKAGEFIPPCTRHVFLKHHPASRDSLPSSWNAADRKRYFNKILKTLHIDDDDDY